MPDTPDVLSLLAALLADNSTGKISAADVRRFLQSVHQEAFDIYNVRNHGAKGDGTNDDTSAIDEAIVAANVADGVLAVPSGDYKITSNLTPIECDVDASSGARIHVYSPATIGITLGVVGGTLRSHGYVKLPAIEQENKVWEGSTPTFGTDVGVQVNDINGWMVWVPYVKNFTEGLHLNPQSGDQASYSTYHIGRLDNNGRNLLVHPEGTGWANQNTFIGGNYFHSSGEGTDITGCRQIWINGEDTSSDPNKLTFINPSVEGAQADIAILLSGDAHYNDFFGYRTESSNISVAFDTKTSGNIRFNNFFGGYGLGETITELGTGLSTNNYFWLSDRFAPFSTTVTGHKTGPVQGQVEYNFADGTATIFDGTVWKTFGSWTP